MCKNIFPMRKVGFLLFLLFLILSCRPSLVDKKRDTIVQTARSFLGFPYRYGGESPEKGFDCSGFVYYVFKVNGIELPRTTEGQLKSGRRVFRRKFKPADLLFFRTGKRSLHVGIYIGRGKMIHVSLRERKVIIEDVRTSYWRKKFYRAKRVI